MALVTGLLSFGVSAALVFGFFAGVSFSQEKMGYFVFFLVVALVGWLVTIWAAANLK